MNCVNSLIIITLPTVATIQASTSHVYISRQICFVAKSKGKPKGANPKPKEGASKFKIPRGPPGEARPDGTFYPGSKNNNPEDEEKSFEHKACQTEISAIDGDTYEGSKSLI